MYELNKIVYDQYSDTCHADEFHIYWWWFQVGFINLTTDVNVIQASSKSSMLRLYILCLNKYSHGPHVVMPSQYFFLNFFRHSHLSYCLTMQHIMFISSCHATNIHNYPEVRIQCTIYSCTCVSYRDENLTVQTW